MSMNIPNSTQATAIEIEALAQRLRERLGLGNRPFIDAIDLLDSAVRTGLIGDYRVVPDSSLSEVEGCWDPASRTIILRNSTIVAARGEDPRARFTIAHELAHAVMEHPGRNRKTSGAQQFGRFVETDERKADDLASAFLAPQTLVDLTMCNTPELLANEFGLPIGMAERRFTQLVNSPQNKPARLAAIPPARRTVIIDTGNYEDALWAMARNAERR